MLNLQGMLSSPAVRKVRARGTLKNSDRHGSHARAIERYKAVMQEPIKVIDIAMKLDMSRQGVYQRMLAYEDKCLVRRVDFLHWVWIK